MEDFDNEVFFSNADIKGLQVFGGGSFGNNIVGCDFRNANMGLIQIENARFFGTDFRGVDLRVLFLRSVVS